jgi:hypothetical protein|tara:strand:- start:3360 stop:3653 length:294 start_codon:yes stop_codon:yes gene_type:complete
MSEEQEPDDAIRELIEAALKSNLDNQKEFKSRGQLIEAIKAIVFEYLDSFIVIGYDFDGKVVQLEGSSSSQQRNALDTLLVKYFCMRTGYDPTRDSL